MTPLKTRLVVFFLLAGLGLSSALAAQKTVPVDWPLKLPQRFLTSNFMEFRGGRFHAGLDLKTQTRQGFPVYAVEDGFIARARCTPTAYGRVVYLQGVSGRTYVFAHLSRFNDELRSRIDRAQQKSGNYRTSLVFEPGQIPIRRGQVLGLTGQSGTAGPHLHFEVRDPQQRPVNPLANGFSVPDTIAPVIHSITAWPVAATTLINGQNDCWALDEADAGGLQGELGVLAVRGPVAFSARMVDASDIRGHKLEPWLIELEVDGELVYRCRNDRFAFSENAQQRLEWTQWADWSGSGRLREHWLHRRKANTLTGREGGLWFLGSGGEGLSPGDHRMRLRVMDFAGGRHEAQWLLRVGKGDPESSAGPWPEQGRSLFLGVQGDLLANPVVGLPDTARLTPFYSQGAPEAGGGRSREFRPEAGDPVLEPLELWSLPTVLGPEPKATLVQQKLQFVGLAEYFLTADWPVESCLPVEFWSPPALDLTPSQLTNPQVGVYRQDRRGHWQLVGPLGRAGELGFLLDEPGLHAVLRDDEPPFFTTGESPLTVPKGRPSNVPGVTMPTWEITPLGLRDAGSGVDSGSLRAALDGETLIVEPDPPRDRLLIHWPWEMTPGDHSLELEVKDMAGNVARGRFLVQAKK